MCKITISLSYLSDYFILLTFSSYFSFSVWCRSIHIVLPGWDWLNLVKEKRQDEVREDNSVQETEI